MHQSVALWVMLRRRGYAVRVRLGVRTRAAALEAHAWLESGDGVIFDSDPTSRYQPVATEFLAPVVRG
jgi:hypothetical protein